MKIIIPGGSGHLGMLIANYLTDLGHEVVVLSRQPQRKRWREIPWDGRSLGDWVQALEGADGVINLAGRSVDCRYTNKNRKAIMDSRVLSTRVIGQALKKVHSKPRFWLQMSTATIYAHHVEGPPHNESRGVLGGDEPKVPSTWRFSIDVAKAWEAEAEAGCPSGVRLVKLRTAMVMSASKGGAFEKLRWLARIGLGGRVGSGKQMMSWLHEDDFVRAIQWLCENPIEGAVNLAAPHPLSQADFMATLRKQLSQPIGLPSPKWLVEMGTLLLRTESELILKSRCVVSEKLPQNGFQFRYPTWQKAAEDLCKTIPKIQTHTMARSLFQQR